MPYNVIQTLLDPLWAKGIQSYFKGTNLAGLDDELIERLVRRTGGSRARRPRSTCTRWAARSRAGPRTRPAFPDRSMPFLLNVVTGWHDAALADAHVEWARG